MKCVILAGGRGSRLSEQSDRVPKPLVEVGGKPILWHIMKTYDHHGIRDFVVCLGFKGYAIKEYFANFHLRHSDVTLDMQARSLNYHQASTEQWTVALIDTGEETQTGGRLRRVKEHLNGTFCMTYGDGVADIDIGRELAFHRSHGKLATVAAIQQPPRFGALDLKGPNVVAMREKSTADSALINGGFFVLETAALDLVADDSISWEREPMERLAAAGDLMAYRHDGFWQAMDTPRERNLLESLWAAGGAPWKVWR